MKNIKNDFYVSFISDNVHKVLFNDGTDVKMGFITGSQRFPNPQDRLNKQNFDQRLDYQEPYSCVRYSPEDNSYSVEAFDTEHIILINKPVVYFDIDGIYQGMLNKGDKIYISGGNDNNTGESRPWCYRITKFEKNGEMINTNVYVSSGLEYASSGPNRAWY